ncbi:serine/threonine-protein kinase pim-1-like [Hemibagrus wyckioides]|uniref:serine/threonine-protein kinase pim-1-like n=1 Tax=Hemibagrus wyckioides TaxID=337641 RepID=UPI00266D89C8|nr:serine/threonine-protein kinase pim-1-like [Hemibagrus wyckioides]
MFKYFHALKLAEIGLSDQALEYCEGIAKSIFTMPRHTSSSLIQSVIKLSYDLLQEKAQETEWLLKLCRLLRDVHVIPPAVFIKLEPPSSSQEFQEELDSRYIVGELLGKGAHSAVYAGVRKADGRQVALKYVTKKVKESFPGTKPREVELMEIVSKQPRCENVVELLECLDVSTSFVLVLERPSPCIDLQTFCRMQRNNRLSEDVAREIMRQVVQAVGHCIAHGVFHGDIHSKNILVNPDTLEVKLIDFGYSDLVSKGGRTGYISCIWSLGLILAQMIIGNVHVASSNQLLEKCSQFVSPECCQLLSMCLKNPMETPAFDEIPNHSWFRQKPSSSQAPEDPGSSN